MIAPTPAQWESRMATYYVDARNGSDSNTGLSANAAWKSVEEVNSHGFRPGDTILFHAGDQYNATLAPSSSGTASAPITFGVYGTGPAPVFYGGADVTDAGWTKGSGNVWSTPVARQGAYDPEKVLFDGEPGNVASKNVGGVDQPGDWYWSGGKLYVYSTQNPSAAFDSVEVNVRDYGILINQVNHVRINGLEVSLARHNVLVKNSTGTELLNLEVHDSVRDGILLQGANGTVIRGGSSHDNGVEGTATRDTHLGHGVLITSGSANNIVEGMRLYNNTEDGVQFGNDTGSGNIIRNNDIYRNMEDGIDIKSGSHTLAGNKIYDNANNAVLVHNSSKTITLTDNHLQTRANANALDVAEGARVISRNNWYEGVDSLTVQLQRSAGDGSSFTNDIFVDGGRKAGAGVGIEGGRGHAFANSTFVMRNDGYAVSVQAGASNIRISDSIVYGERSALMWISGGGLSLNNNVYWSNASEGRWVRIDGSGDRGSSHLLGMDRRGTAADPRFNNTGQDDFTVKPGSAAAGLGASGASRPNGGPGRPDTPPPGNTPPGNKPPVVPPNDNGGSGGGRTENTINGTSAGDRLNGQSRNDLINGRDGRDRIDGGAGHDILNGGAGGDTLIGGAGSDTLDGGAGNDLLTGSSGADTFVFGVRSGHDTITDFTPGSDRIDLTARSGLNFRSLLDDARQSGRDTILRFDDDSRITLKGIDLDELKASDFTFASGGGGGRPGGSGPGNGAGGAGGNNALNGTSGADRIVGQGRNDDIAGKAGNDRLDGGAGDDRLDGGAGDDILIGGAGSDTLVGGAGDDRLTGLAGADTFVFGARSGSDTITDFRPGDDRIDLSDRSGLNFRSVLDDARQSGRDTILNFDDGSRITLKDVDRDDLRANDFQFGNGGNTGRPGGPARDNDAGGAGQTNNTINGTAANNKIVAQGRNDRIDGKAGNDVINGGPGHDTILGGPGRDTLHGDDGNDRLDGGAGDDTLKGWAGADTFVFTRGGGHDLVKDFKPGTDTVDLSAYGLASVRPLLASADFERGNTVLDLPSGDHIEFANIAPHQLSVDDFVT